MNGVTLDDFEGYFRELHGSPPFDNEHSKPPYDWQSRLAERFVTGHWPEAIDLPTGSGKTACIDTAVFALACQASLPKTERTAPRRVFFCVNRRVIVDEAHRRARTIAKKIWNAESDGNATRPTLRRVAHALRCISGLTGPDLPPVDVLELRGGIYRDNRWARSPTQPAIICTTIDQLGSRLLFRGYGASLNAAPIQASLIAYDSLVLLDEAHISEPFRQTLKSVTSYLDPEKWAVNPIAVRPMIVVPMTATSSKSDSDVIRLSDRDRENQGLADRLKASKKARLKLLQVQDATEAAVQEAMQLANNRPTAVGIVVNRVATAKAIYRKLRDANKDKPEVVVELVIGSMRPIDRDRQAQRLQELIGSDRPKVTEKTSFVVATQCLEVGADYDFDVLVTECASLDALRQRFGRLNRGGRPIEAQAIILACETEIQSDEKLDDNMPLDPIYGNALCRTWNWLHGRGEPLQPDTKAKEVNSRRKKKALPVENKQIDFGIDAFQPHWESLNAEDRRRLSAPSASKDAPTMLPAYIDFWCQTSPSPIPDPNVALFIHGPNSGEPDVQVCWRADLVNHESERTQWCEIVSLLPPTSAECMSVPISRVRQWLIGDAHSTDAGDLLGTVDKDSESKEGKSEQKRQVEKSRAGVLWRGARQNKSKPIMSPDELEPWDTLVLPAQAAGWNELGHVPDATSEPIDVAEPAFCLARDRAVLRLHPTLKSQLPDVPALEELFNRIADQEEPLSKAEFRRLLKRVSCEARKIDDDFATVCCNLAKPSLEMIREDYPDGLGCVLTTRRRLNSATDWFLPAIDDGEDERSLTLRDKPVGLVKHTQHVRDEVMSIIAGLPFDELADVYRLAAELHDRGKADERFQAMLQRTDRTDAWLLTGMESALLAKSDGMPRTPRERKIARERAGLPEGFRHEMLSVLIAERSNELLPNHPHRDLILHLIAAHHGFARPFAPLIIDIEPPPPNVTFNGVTLDSATRMARPPHRIDSGISERFWTLTRRYGWWGLAFLEAVLRLADQQASANEDASIYEAEASEAEPVEAGV